MLLLLFYSDFAIFQAFLPRESIFICIFARLYARIVPMCRLATNTAKMTHKELMSEVQRYCGLDRQQSAMLLSAFEQLLVDEAIELNPVEVEGLGTFVSTKHPEYIQEDPHTGASTLFPPRYTYRFQSSIAL